MRGLGSPFAFFTILIIVLSCTIFVIPNAFATTWYVGQGLKPGDYYRYSVTDVFWHNLAPIEMDFWVKNQTSNGLNLQMVVHDGSIVQKGIVTIGNITPDPIYSDQNLADYANVYKLTLTWLDSFAIKTAPVGILSPVWGHTGIFGEATIGSIGMQTVTVPAGSFNVSTLYFHDSGVDSYIWVNPSLAFPVKAKVYAIKTSGAPTIGYQYSLLENGNSQQPPSFLNVKSTNHFGGSAACPTPDFATDSVHNSQSTDSATAAIEYLYSPKVPHQGCPMDWRIWFEPVYSATQRIPDIHYDIYAVDGQDHELDSLAKDIGRTDIYVAVGADEQTFIEKQPPPVVHYVIYVAGTGPPSGITDVSKTGLVRVDVNVAPPFTSQLPTSTTTGANNMSNIVIPSWIKNNAKWWSQGQVDDSEFVKGIQYLIQNGIMVVPHAQSSSSGSQQIPIWIKNNAGWWAAGQISNSDFVKGIEYMISSGIIQLNF